MILGYSPPQVLLLAILVVGALAGTGIIRVKVGVSTYPELTRNAWARIAVVGLVVALALIFLFRTIGQL